MKPIPMISALLCMLLLCAAVSPAPVFPVGDYAGFLSDEERARIERESAELQDHLRQNYGLDFRLAVLTYPDLAGGTPEAYANEKAADWGLLSADAYILLFVSPEGSGIYTAAPLTPEADRELHAAMEPYLDQGDYARALLEGCEAAQSLLYREYPRAAGRDGRNLGRSALVVGMVGLIFWRYLRISQTTRKRLMGSRSAYRRKNFTKEPKAFDEDDSFSYRDLD